MQDLARILFAAVMGASMTATLLIVPTIGRGAKTPVIPVVSAVALLAWLAAAVVSSQTAQHHVAAPPALAVALAALWLGVGPLRRAWEGVPMQALVGLQALRFFGGYRVLAVNGGWLPGDYGRPFGAVDVALAVAAVVLSWGWAGRSRWARGATLAWSAAGVAATAAGMVVQARLVRPMPGFEALWSAFLTPLLCALLAVTAWRAWTAPRGTSGPLRGDHGD